MKGRNHPAPVLVIGDLETPDDHALLRLLAGAERRGLVTLEGLVTDGLWTEPPPAGTLIRPGGELPVELLVPGSDSLLARRILAAAPDRSVRLVVTGQFGLALRLLDAAPELCAAKLHSIVVAAEVVRGTDGHWYAWAWRSDTTWAQMPAHALVTRLQRAPLGCEVLIVAPAAVRPDDRRWGAFAWLPAARRRVLHRAPEAGGVYARSALAAIESRAHFRPVSSPDVPDVRVVSRVPDAVVSLPRMAASVSSLLAASPQPAGAGRRPGTHAGTRRASDLTDAQIEALAVGLDSVRRALTGWFAALAKRTSFRDVPGFDHLVDAQEALDLALRALPRRARAGASPRSSAPQQGEGVDDPISAALRWFESVDIAALERAARWLTATTPPSTLGTHVNALVIALRAAGAALTDAQQPHH